MKKYLITIEKVQKETDEAEFEANTAMEALDTARQLISEKNRNANPETIYAVKSVKEKENA